ncbi:MAG: sugar phosphate isomerase/epimerase family protein [Thermodesulfobacteriota bacterium]|nr:sugar phosphate isomerase/epimerase family protein [Thermodesulfobacteriota bacterium]
MKFAFSSNAFRNHSLKDASCAISAAGYTGIEIMCDTPHAYPANLTAADIQTMRDDLVAKRLDIANLNAFMLCAIDDFHHPSWIEDDKDYRELRIKHTLECIDLAVHLGSRSISTEPGGPLNGISRKHALELFIEGLSRVLPYAQENDIMILIEPEPGLLIQNSEEFISLMKRLSHPCVGLNLDIGHVFCVGEDPVEKIIQLKDYIHHFHLEDIPETREHKHLLLGEGAIDIPKVLETIDSIGYNGYVTIELYPYLQSAHEAARKAIEYIQDICGYGKA